MEILLHRTWIARALLLWTVFHHDCTAASIASLASIGSCDARGLHMHLPHTEVHCPCHSLITDRRMGLWHDSSAMVKGTSRCWVWSDCLSPGSSKHAILLVMCAITSMQVLPWLWAIFCSGVDVWGPTIIGTPNRSYVYPSQGPTWSGGGAGLRTQRACTGVHARGTTPFSVFPRVLADGFSGMTGMGGGGIQSRKALKRSFLEKYRTWGGSPPPEKN